jgi:hypothetical protein
MEFYVAGVPGELMAQPVLRDLREQLEIVDAVSLGNLHARRQNRRRCSDRCALRRRGSTGLSG